jgi:hypothetical protein
MKESEERNKEIKTEKLNKEGGEINKWIGYKTHYKVGFKTSFNLCSPD